VSGGLAFALVLAPGWSNGGTCCLSRPVDVRIPDLSRAGEAPK
jgi:hypothetical protein